MCNISFLLRRRRRCSSQIEKESMYVGTRVESIEREKEGKKKKKEKRQRVAIVKILLS